MLAGIERPQPVVPAVEVSAVRAARGLLQLQDDAMLHAARWNEWQQIEQWRRVGVVPMLGKPAKRGERLRLVISPHVVEHRKRKESVTEDRGRRSDGCR